MGHTRREWRGQRTLSSVRRIVWPRWVRFSLSRATSAFCAETLALAQAISWLRNHPTIQDVRVYTDCLSLLQALSSRKNTDPRIADMKRALCHIGSASPIRLYHVPGHAGVFGNEIADYVASRAARQGDPRPLQWSLRNVRAVFRTELYRLWALQWFREDEDTALDEDTARPIKR
ncbi:hypothetical protein MTO96_052204 [Rhipicephalus appendiculatus]